MNNIKDIIKRERIDYMGDHHAIFVHRKLEKITMAIYAVTNFFPEEEPLKFLIRQKSINLMSFIMSLIKKDREEFSDATSLISEIDSYLRIALISNLISEMNYSVLGEELKRFSNSIKEKRQNSFSKKIILPKDFFEEDEDINTQNIIKDNFDKGHSKGQKRVEVGELVVQNKRQINSSKKINIKDKKAKVKLKKVESKRKDLIIEFLKDKKEVTIKDIAKNIKDCSEKTIQRELTDLVKDNLIKKEGERRWSRYSLK